MSDLDLAAIEDAHIHVDRVGTHYPDCHLSHRPCAIAALVAEVRALRERVATLEGERDEWRAVAENQLGYLRELKNQSDEVCALLDVSHDQEG